MSQPNLPRRCAPDNHLVAGHAVWHVLNAFAITRRFFFYARLNLAAGRTKGLAVRAASEPAAKPA